MIKFYNNQYAYAKDTKAMKKKGWTLGEGSFVPEWVGDFIFQIYFKNGKKYKKKKWQRKTWYGMRKIGKGRWENIR